MNHTASVGIGHRLSDGDDVGNEAESLREVLRLLNDLGDRAAKDHLLRVEGFSIAPSAHVLNWDDGRILQTGGDQGSSIEPASRLVTSAEQLFDCNGAVEQHVARA